LLELCGLFGRRGLKPLLQRGKLMLDPLQFLVGAFLHRYHSIRSRRTDQMAAENEGGLRSALGTTGRLARSLVSWNIGRTRSGLEPRESRRPGPGRFPGNGIALGRRGLEERRGWPPPAPAGCR